MSSKQSSLSSGIVWNAHVKDMVPVLLALKAYQLLRLTHMTRSEANTSSD